MTFEKTPTPIFSGIFVPAMAPLSSAIVLTVAMVAFEGLSVSAALPEIGLDLGSVARLPWIMTAYLLASGLALALAGSLIDRVGTRIVFRITTTVFVISSAACALAPDLGLLISVRIVQGLSGGATIAATGSAIGLAYPSAIRSRVYALSATVWGVMAVAGPALAAALLTWFDWRSIFGVNVPLGLIAARLGWHPMPGRRGARTPFRIDFRGAILVAGFTTSGLLAVSETSAGRPLWLATALILAGLFWYHTGNVAEPILGRRYFAKPPFRDLALTAGFVMAAGMGAEAFLPLYLRGAREATTNTAAWSVLFLAFGWTLSANIAGRLYHRWPEAQIALLGTLLMLPTLTLVVVAILARAPLGLLFALYLVVGFGIGGTTNACLTLVQQWAEEHEIGRATAAHQFLRNLAVTFGTAAAGTAVVAMATSHSNRAETPASPLMVVDSSFAALSPEGLSTGFAAAHGVALVLAAGAVLAARRTLRESVRMARRPLAGSETRPPPEVVATDSPA